LDDLVLDVSEFAKWHPGGKFVLEHNKGRDISKFFYGGYNLEGNLTGNPPPGYNHSNYARKIVNGLIVAQFDSRDLQAQATRVKLVETHEQNSSTSTIILRNTSNLPVPGFKSYFPGINTIGKHFLVRSLHNKRVHRHYTIANSMRPDFYGALLNSLNGSGRKSVATP